MAEPLFKRAAAPLLRILERNNLKPEDIDFVEMLGGGTRVPRVQVRMPGMFEKDALLVCCKRGSCDTVHMLPPIRAGM